MLVAGIDFETSSLDTDTCLITEVAICLWNPREQKIVESISALAQIPLEAHLDNSDVTGIDDELVRLHGWHFDEFILMIADRIEPASYIMAHNAMFDRAILSRFILNLTPWIDTMTDIPYPQHIKTRSLPYLAAEHGFVNPFPHRALFDVATMIRIAELYDFDEILTYAHSPTLWIRASVSFDDRGLAKNRYFKWDPVNQFWVKQVKELNLEYEESQAGFPIDLLPGYVYKEQYL